MENKRCDICQLYREEIPIDPRRYICLDCDLRYLYGIADKARAIYEARELARIQKLGLRQALKIVAGRLSLEIEKEKNLVKRRKEKGQSVDAYVMGKRLSGYFNV